MRGTAEPEFASIADRNSVVVDESDTIIICDGSNSGETFTRFRGVLSSTMGKLVKKREVDDSYLRLFVYSQVDILKNGKVGAAIPHLNQDAMAELPIPLPALSQQHRIVAILDEAFAGIATAKANVEKGLIHAHELFDSRLASIFHGDSGRWPRKSLREVSKEFGRGKSKHRPRNDPALYGGDYPFIQTGDVRNANHLITEYTQTYNGAGLAQSKLWPAGTLCITIAANIAETGILGFDACFPDSVIGVVADPKQTTNAYLEYLLRSVKADLQAKGKGSAQNNINLATFENERYPFPSLREQVRIVEELDALRHAGDGLESLCTRKLAALDELKQSILQQAFSGQF